MFSVRHQVVCVQRMEEVELFQRGICRLIEAQKAFLEFGQYQSTRIRTSSAEHYR